MFCEICDAEITSIITRYQHTPYLDGKFHNEVCSLCSAMAEKYCNMLTGNISSKEYILSLGFSELEYDKVFKIIKKLRLNIVAENPVFTVLSSKPLYFRTVNFNGIESIDIIDR